MTGYRGKNHRNYRNIDLDIYKPRDTFLTAAEGDPSVCYYLHLDRGQKIKALEAIIYSQRPRHRDTYLAAAEALFLEDCLFTACRGFSKANYKHGLLRVIQAAGRDAGDAYLPLLNEAFSLYLGLETFSRILDSFYSWVNSKGFSEHEAIAAANPFNILPILNMASHLASEYSTGVAIAKGGLPSGYIFSLMGLDVKVADCHKQTRDISFSWRDPVSRNDFKGKKVAVLDVDVDSGRTSARVLEELQNYGPKTIDLILNLDPINENNFTGGGTVLSRVPDGFREVYFPGRFDYLDFDKAVQSLVDQFVQ